MSLAEATHSAQLTSYTTKRKTHKPFKTKHLWTLAHGIYDVAWSRDEDLLRVRLNVRTAVDVETVNDSLTVDARRSREDGSSHHSKVSSSLGWYTRPTSDILLLWQWNFQTKQSLFLARFSRVKRLTMKIIIIRLPPFHKSVTQFCVVKICDPIGCWLMLAHFSSRLFFFNMESI